jgi:glyoxylase-like metal-dependent hydrolase (beta-lactamase superfamily II)
MRIGAFEVVSLSDGSFRLDGGAMFGIIPKVLWSRRMAPDDANRILMGLNPLLIRTPEMNVLVDTGIGDKHDEKARKIYAINRDETLLSSLASHGLEPGDIDVVVLTHLHFDHSGGNTFVSGPGAEPQPTFPGLDTLSRGASGNTPSILTRDPGRVISPRTFFP